MYRKCQIIFLFQQDMSHVPYYVCAYSGVLGVACICLSEACNLSVAALKIMVKIKFDQQRSGVSVVICCPGLALGTAVPGPT
jgi:hypothetical protein